MNPTDSSLAKDMRFGQRVMITSTPDADMKENRDYVIGSLGIAYRRRRFKVSRYGEISIRNSRASGAKTERAKILDGECRSELFIWEFEDAYVLCKLEDVLSALRSDVGYAKDNNDGTTSAYYIPITKVHHLLIPRAAAVEA